MNGAMWGRALRIIPRIRKDEWNQHNRRYGLLFLAGPIGEVVLKLVFKVQDQRSEIYERIFRTR